MEILLSFGPFKIYTLSVFVVLAFLWVVFVVSRRAFEFHLDRGKVFDLSVVGFIFGVVSLKSLELMWGSFFDFWYFIFGALVGVITFALWTKSSNLAGKWKIFEILDIVAPGMSMGFSVFFLGLFAASFEWINLILMVWFFVCFVFLFGLEYKYRFWSWYRGGLSTSRDGLVFSLFVVSLGLGRVYFEPVIGGVVIILGLVLIYVRSGRSLKNDFLKVLRKR